MSQHKKHRKKNRKRKRRLIQKAKRRLSVKEVVSSDLLNLFWTIDELKRLCRKNNGDFSSLLFLLYVRVSTPEQDRAGHLANRKRQLILAAAALECQVVLDENGLPLVIEEVVHGDSDRIGLEMVAALAKSYGAIPLAETACRWMRPKAFHPYKNPDAELTVEDVMNFLEKTALTPFAIILEPDVTFDVVKRFQKHIGIIAGCGHGGRPKKMTVEEQDERREKYLARVLKLHRHGLGYGKIAAKLKLTKSLVQYWIANHSI